MAASLFTISQIYSWWPNMRKHSMSLKSLALSYSLIIHARQICASCKDTLSKIQITLAIGMLENDTRNLLSFLQLWKVCMDKHFVIGHSAYFTIRIQLNLSRRPLQKKRFLTWLKLNLKSHSNYTSNVSIRLGSRNAIDISSSLKAN